MQDDLGAPMRDDFKEPMKSQIDQTVRLIFKLSDDLDTLNKAEIRNKVKEVVHSTVDLFDFIERSFALSDYPIILIV